MTGSRRFASVEPAALNDRQDRTKFSYDLILQDVTCCVIQFDPNGLTVVCTEIDCESLGKMGRRPGSVWHQQNVDKLG